MGTHFTRIYHHEERTVLSEVVFMKNLKELIILHSNDMHGDFLAEQIDEKLVGGVSLLSGYEILDMETALDFPCKGGKGDGARHLRRADRGAGSPCNRHQL